MPFKLTIITTRPAGVTAKWPYEMEKNEHPTLGNDQNDIIDDWATNQPGYMDRLLTWVEVNSILEKNYIFDSRENAEAFLEARANHELHSAKSEYFKSNGFVSTKTITEI
jgi:hypothetical protein